MQTLRDKSALLKKICLRQDLQPTEHGFERSTLKMNPLTAESSSRRRHIAFVGDYYERFCVVRRGSARFRVVSGDATILVCRLYDSATGGCRDGLHHDRTNQKQGAESSLAFYLAHAEMTLAQNLMEAQTPIVT